MTHSRDVEKQRFDIDVKTIQKAADRHFGHPNGTFEDGVTVSEPYWIDEDYGTVRVGIGYGKPDEKGIRPGCFGANYNYRTGEFE